MVAASDGVVSLDPVPAPATIERVLQLLMSLPGRRQAVDAQAVLNGLFGDALVEKETALCVAADEEQDRAAIDLATKMSGDGFGRLNPFKSFGVDNPSKLCGMGDVTEAEIAIGLCARVIVHPKSSPATKKAAATLDRAAKKVKEAAPPRRKALEARAAAVDHRDGELQREYAVALANLRAAVKYADYVENTAHYLNVFPRVPKTKKKQVAEPVS